MGPGIKIVTCVFQSCDPHQSVVTTEAERKLSASAAKRVTFLHYRHGSEDPKAAPRTLLLRDYLPTVFLGSIHFPPHFPHSDLGKEEETHGKGQNSL